MTLQHWWTFLIATFFICGSPGPNMLQVMMSSVNHGLRRAVFTMAGCFLAVILMIAASVAGVGALLKIAPSLFDILRCTGALYLIYLGVQAWRAPVAGMDGNTVSPPNTSPVNIFRKGFLVGISNPKALLFAAAFFPQFIDPQAPEWPQLLILLATFSVMEIGWYIAYALGGSHLSAFMRRADIRKKFNRLTGGLFAMFGVMLIAKSA